MEDAVCLLISDRSRRPHRFAPTIRNPNTGGDGLPAFVLDLERQEAEFRAAGRDEGRPLVQFDGIDIETARKWFCGLNCESEINRFSPSRSCEQEPARLPAARLPTTCMLSCRAEGAALFVLKQNLGAAEIGAEAPGLFPLETGLPAEQVFLARAHGDGGGFPLL